VSKSAVSNALKVLSVMDVIQEKTKAGARKRFFKVTPERVFAPETVVKAYRESRLIFEDIRKLRKKKDSISDDLLRITSFIKILETEYPKLYEEMLKKEK
jgi:DNA-binding transcriptional regulator GbsR (MarR family)